MNDPAQIASKLNGEVFVFDYANANVGDTITLQSGSWGNYSNSGASVETQVLPSTDDDGVSLPGSVTFSVPLLHLEAYTSAHIRWVGEDVSLSYSLNNTTWTPITEGTAIALNPASDPDLDIKVEFAGGAVADPAYLTSISVYVMTTDTIRSINGSRTLNFSADPLSDEGLVVDAPVTLSLAAESSDDTQIATVEMWVNPSTTTVFTGAPAGTLYCNGVSGDLTPGVLQHVVFVLDAPDAITLSIGPDLTVSHLAIYSNSMTADEVAALYTSNIGPEPIRIDDSGIITVTLSSPATKIYAYSWSIIPGSRS